MSRLLGGLHAALLAGGLTGGPNAAHADDAAVKPEDPKRWTWEAGYKADVLRGAATGTVWVGHLNLRANADADALFGWGGTTLHAEALLNHGGKPNRRIGSAQGISNLEVADSAARLYATWVQKEFDTGSRLLFDLYDLNSEFYATDASGLLIHPSFGIGIDFSQSGRNGPSIFPNLGLALRAKVAHEGGDYSQVALIDGVPGDPEHPGRTVVSLSRKDAVLLVGEYGWQQEPAGATQAATLDHWGVGARSYTQRSDRHDATGRERNHGVYALAQTGCAAGRTRARPALCAPAWRTGASVPSTSASTPVCCWSGRSARRARPSSRRAWPWRVSAGLTATLRRAGSRRMRSPSKSAHAGSLGRRWRCSRCCSAPGTSAGGREITRPSSAPASNGRRERVRARARRDEACRCAPMLGRNATGPAGPAGKLAPCRHRRPTRPASHQSNQVARHA